MHPASVDSEKGGGARAMSGHFSVGEEAEAAPPPGVLRLGAAQSVVVQDYHSLEECQTLPVSDATTY